MTTLDRPLWHRDGPTWVNSGETYGMEAANPEDEIVGDDYTAYYLCDDGRRAAVTYYVERTLTRNQPEERVAWVVEEMYWVGTPEGPDGDMPDQDYGYGSGSPFFYESEETALEVARRMADTDESPNFC